MFRIGSVASGMGTHLHGLKKKGGVCSWAIECDQEIAQVYRNNHAGQLYVNRVENLDPKELGEVDCLIATLSCKNASFAKGANWGETQDDLNAAIATSKIISTLLPKVFLLENVWRYRDFESFKLIQDALKASGYYFQHYRLNLADFGVAQSRIRLYLVAVRGGAFWDINPTHTHLGWYAAIKDLIPTLPETKLASWQKAKFPELNETCLIPDHSNWTTVGKNKPASTVRAGHQSFKALIKRDGGGRDSDRIYQASEPAFTIRAFGRNCDGHSVPGTVIADDRIVSISPRACLRFFGDAETADSIWLPTRKVLAQEVVGNGASWVIFEHLINHIGVFN